MQIYELLEKICVPRMETSCLVKQEKKKSSGYYIVIRIFWQFFIKSLYASHTQSIKNNNNKKPKEFCIEKFYLTQCCWYVI